MVGMQRRVRFVGQIRPQVGAWFFDGPITARRENEFIQIIVQQSIFVVRVDTDGPEEIDSEWIEGVWRRCLAIVRSALDTLGFHRGASLEVERLTGMVDDKSVVFSRPIQPRFQLGEGDVVEGDVITPYFTEAVTNPAFRHALGDVRQAQQLDDDAAFYCYRAIEGLRQSFVLPGESETSDKAKSWERLRSALNVSEDRIREVAEASKSRRHGGDDLSEQSKRVEFVVFTKDLIARYVQQLPQPEAAPVQDADKANTDPA